MPDLKQSAPTIAVLGECMVEVRPEKPEGDYSGASLSANIGFGGDTLNVSVYLARQGVAVEYATALGDDPISDWIQREWLAEGVGCSLVRRQPGQVPGLYLIDVDDAGERSFYYWRANSPASRLLDSEQAANNLFQELLSFHSIYLSGITLAIYSTTARQRLLSFLARYRAHGGKIFFDNNYRPKQWPDRGEARVVFEQMYRLSDIALPTLDDEFLLYGDTDAESVIHRLQSWGVPEIVLKNGPDGCTVIRDSARDHVATLAVEKVVDTTAAGDSFNGGYLGARLAGSDPIASARQGNRLAGIVVQHRGAIVPADVTAGVTSRNN